MVSDAPIILLVGIGGLEAGILNIDRCRLAQIRKCLMSYFSIDKASSPDYWLLYLFIVVICYN